MPYIATDVIEGYVKELRRKADARDLQLAPIMFDFNAHAKLLERHDHPLHTVVRGMSYVQPQTAYIGEPISIHEPVKIVFDRVKRSNALLLAPKLDDVVGILQAALLSIYYTNKAAGTATKFHIVDALGGAYSVLSTLNEVIPANAYTVYTSIDDYTPYERAQAEEEATSYIILLGMQAMTAAYDHINSALAATDSKPLHTIAYSNTEALATREHRGIVDEFNYIVLKKGIKLKESRGIRNASALSDKEALLHDITANTALFRDYAPLDDYADEVLEALGELEIATF